MRTTKADTQIVTYTVAADIEYLDGALAGLTIPAGYSVTFGNMASAHRAASWVGKVRRENDFVRAVGTGNRYRFVGLLTISERRVI